jgi:hypothetical protein
MKRRFIPLTALCLLTAGLYVQSASAAVINFDNVAAGTNINNQYAGVTFGCINGSTSANICTGNSSGSFAAGNAYAVAFGLPASPPNVIGFNSGTFADFFIDSRWGYLTAAFATPVISVSIDALGTPPPEYFPPLSTGPYINAYGATGNFLASAVYNNSSLTWQTLAISQATADIYYVLFSAQFDAAAPLYGTFDNLCYSATATGTGTCAGGGGGTTTVPEPATLSLLGLGLASVRRPVRLDLRRRGGLSHPTGPTREPNGQRHRLVRSGCERGVRAVLDASHGRLHRPGPPQCLLGAENGGRQSTRSRAAFERERRSSASAADPRHQMQ